MGTLLLKALLVLAAVSPGEVHRWTLYMNPRFGTRLLYPADMFGRGVESDNGDGITLHAPDGASLAIFGKWNVDRQSPAQYVQWLASLPDYRQLRYRLVRPGFAVVSGLRGGRIYYERYAFAGPDGAIHGFVLQYPAAYRGRWDPIVARLSASLSWRPVTVR